MQQQNRYLDYLIDSSFQGINRLFVLCFFRMAWVMQKTKYIFLPIYK